MALFDVVIPTAGRPTLGRMLRALESQQPRPAEVIVVDDRELGRGPAAARNAGWRRARAEWVAFLDDDVEVPEGWTAALERDLRHLPSAVAGSQGRIQVPLAGARPTDWERQVKGLERARWATADIAYRRSALRRVGGFDERFRRAYREDADLALRMLDAGYLLVRGERTSFHPVPPADRWISLRRQVGNQDDPLMDRLHGRHWRLRAGAPAGRRPAHLLTTALAIAATGWFLAGRRRDAGAAGLGWAALTADFAWSRFAPGPRTRDELLTLALTSPLIPPLAAYHWLRGRWRWRKAQRLPAAVLFDRDGTLLEDVPYNADPEKVRPLPEAREALDRLRSRGIRLGLISNQSGVARGLISSAGAEAVMARTVELLGPFDHIAYCPHAPGAGCDCRKPAPGLVLEAAAALGVQPGECLVVGDIGSDVAAARAAGARALLVPTAVTRREEVAAAPAAVRSLGEAVDSILGRAS